MKTTTRCFSRRDLERVQAQPLVRKVEFYHELPSTNDRALECAAAGGGDTPLLVLAELQTAGRGRGESRWWSARGALTFSLVVDTTSLSIPAERLPPISLATALGVCDALGTLHPNFDFQLKWPNDVYLGRRKIAGVLVERQTLCPDRLVVGVGININNSFFSAPDALRSVATSLHEVSGQRYDLTDVLLAVLGRVFVRHEMLAAPRASLAEQLQPYCLLRGRKVVATTAGRRVAGRCRGVDDFGSLVIEDDVGRVVRLLSGTVVQIR